VQASPPAFSAPSPIYAGGFGTERNSGIKIFYRLKY